MSTMNRSILSLLTVKFAAEYILNILPRGTHDWRKFINPKNLSKLLTNTKIDTLKV